MNYVRKANSVQAVKLDPGTGDITLSGVTVHAGNYLTVDETGTVAEVDAATFDAEYEPTPEPAAAQSDETVPAVDENGNPVVSQ